MTETMPPDSDDLRLLSLIQDASFTGDPVVPPIYQTSLFTFPNYHEMFETYAGRVSRPVYSRGINPTVRVLEEKIAVLEEAEDAVALASGMAAISTAILSVVKPGDRIVSVNGLYPDAFRFMEMFLKRHGISVEYVDGRDPDVVSARLDGAALLYIETPASWTFETFPIASLTKIAREKGVTTIADNSWATPLFQCPLTLGCDIVVHSMSKYISGHSDVVAGVIASSRERIARMRTEIIPFMGGKLSPMEAWLIIRGLRTLELRMERHQKSTRFLATKLAAHPHVSRIYLPGVSEPFPAGLTGHSGLFSAQLKENVDIARFCDGLQHFRLGVSWGGHESLALPSDIPLVQVGGPNQAQFFGVPKGLMRFSIGLEPVDILWADLAAALDAALLEDDVENLQAGNL